MKLMIILLKKERYTWEHGMSLAHLILVQGIMNLNPYCFTGRSPIYWIDCIKCSLISNCTVRVAFEETVQLHIIKKSLKELNMLL